LEWTYDQARTVSGRPNRANIFSALEVLAKNVNTVWREAEKLLGDDTAALQMVDPLT
jgi:hypothetical protein